MTSTPEELRGQVAEARERLGATVEELAAKADLKGRAQHKVAEVKGHMRHRVQHTAEHMRGSAAHAAHQVQEKSQTQLHTATEKAAQTGRRPVPIAVTGGLVALAVGLAVRGRQGMARVPARRTRMGLAVRGRRGLARVPARRMRAYRRTARAYGRTARAYGRMAGDYAYGRMALAYGRRTRAQAAKGARGRSHLVPRGRAHARGGRH